MGNEIFREKYLELIAQYKQLLHNNQAVAFDNEKYKWQLLTDCTEKNNLEMVDLLRQTNLIHQQFHTQTLKSLIENDAEQFNGILNKLFNENVDLQQRIDEYAHSTVDLCKKYDWGNLPNDERTAAALLTCHNPQIHTFYKNSFYSKFCDFLNIEKKHAGSKYVHYLSLIKEFSKIIAEDAELKSIFQKATERLIQSPLLIAQNIVYVIFDRLNNSNMEEIQGFVVHDTTDWKDNLIVEMKTSGYGCIWWHNKPVDANDVILQVKNRIAKGETFKYYIIENKRATYCANIIDFSTNEDYKQKSSEWKNKEPAWFKSSFNKYEDGKKHAAIVFLTDKFEKLAVPIDQHLFSFYKNKNGDGNFNMYAYTNMLTNRQFREKLNNEKTMKTLMSYTKLLQSKKNIILQGAPGTGKTYNTASIAVAMCNPSFSDFADHQKVMDEYKRLQTEHQIEFCTFHQSMDYEDFVEGLKPKINGDNVEYVVEDGIFKDICNRAKQNWQDSQKSESEQIEDMQTRELFEKYCTHIEGQLATEDSVELYTKSKMRIRNINRIKNGTAYSVQLAKDATSPTQGLKIDIVERDYQNFKNGKITTYEDIMPSYESKSAFHGNAIYYFELYKKMREFEKTISLSTLDKKIELKNYLLIIDEINRGNVSKIFGELITLLEADKRIGADHPIELTLPYSKDKFGVPSNLYIIGTMNTTDRSTGTIDYAIRRRFAFVTLPSKEGIISSDENCTACKLFREVEKFIKDHKVEDMDINDLMVGHSYFMAKDEELKLKMEYEVIPLLKEYIKDGILKDCKEKDKYFSAWKNGECHSNDSQEKLQ